jgi:hypothetical protein
VVSPEMRRVAEREHLSPEAIGEEVAAGRMVIPANPRHATLDPMGIGLRARVKVNANIGSSPTTSSLSEEVDKLRLAERWGADTVMDLSTGKRIDATREAVLETTTVPIGTVPIYQALERVKRPEDHRRAAARRDRAPGAAARGLHDDPRRGATGAPAALPAPRDRDRVARRRSAGALDGPPQAREPAAAPGRGRKRAAQPPRPIAPQTRKRHLHELTAQHLSIRPRDRRSRPQQTRLAEGSAGEATFKLRGADGRQRRQDPLTRLQHPNAVLIIGTDPLREQLVRPAKELLNTEQARAVEFALVLEQLTPPPQRAQQHQLLPQAPPPPAPSSSSTSSNCRATLGRSSSNARRSFAVSMPSIVIDISPSLVEEGTTSERDRTAAPRSMRPTRALPTGTEMCTSFRKRIVRR